MAKIRIMVSRHSAFYSPLISTIAAGFLEEEGLESSYAVLPHGESLQDYIARGEIDLGQSAVSGSWGAMEQGRRSETVHFAQINERDGFFVAAREPDPGFSWGKLAGKRVLVDHMGQPLAMFKFACHKTGLAYDSIEAIDVGGPDEMDAAFRAGQGEYVHLQGPYPQQLEKEGVGHVVASVGEAIGPVAFSSVCSSREFPATDAAGAFMRAFRKARKWVNETPAGEIADREAGYFPKIDREVLASTIGFYQGLGCWNPDPEISRESYEVALDVFLHSGLITKRHPYEEVVAAPPGA